MSVERQRGGRETDELTLLVAGLFALAPDPRSSLPALSLLAPRLTAVLGNPLFLVKARLQAYSPHHQIGRSSFNYAGTWDGLRSIVRSDGWGGLARGVDAAMLRTAMGSSVSAARREGRWTCAGLRGARGRGEGQLVGSRGAIGQRRSWCRSQLGKGRVACASVARTC